MNDNVQMERLALGVGVVIGLILAAILVGLTSQDIDPDLQKIQRQRDAMRLYEEASK